ncbi:hypothetical protein AJ79_04260 [Helicocarpus griseus UAMH5409]|uniref:Calcineurin-like phosphoesterase domain-containing protein n=1 Tax=Helicocarpus griseus UAMH5409 TaxID=1447875 RepID=A0A2B7XTJ1_9EURO|nr:hypothetical protein AJ79_04260 [Helicocarpus griseus UAMH5409]
MFRNQADLSVILHRQQPSTWSELLSHPVIFLARKLYAWRKLPGSEDGLHDSRYHSPITVVCISDTHNCQPQLPDGDILVHAGDLTQSGSQAEIQSAIDWLNRQPHAHKVIIAGNHDLMLDEAYKPSLGFGNQSQNRILWGNVIYLQNSSTVVRCSRDREIKIYGSPASPRHGNWAFQYPRTSNVWKNTIPSDIDILITHVPPQGHLDVNRFGCRFLLEEIWKLQKKPRLHVIGHVHEGYGVENARFDRVQRAYDDVILCKGGILGLT